MTEEIQQLINRGICGVIVQGFVCRGAYQRTECERSTGTPSRCLSGHTMSVPLGELGPFTTPLFRASERVSRRLESINDASKDVDDLRHRLSEYLTAEGYDDSCCWWEVEA